MKNKSSSIVLSHPSDALTGEISAPGDKSISHRALMFGAMAEGTSRITGLLEGADIMATAEAMRAFGAVINREDDGTWTVTGCGDAGWRAPEEPVDFGNAGTGVRLVMGAAAGYGIETTFIGDESLTGRPMGRVLNPLRDMGAKFNAAEGDRLPVTLTKGNALTPITYTPPHASAQVKSAMLLAGLQADGTTIIKETHPTRDHTENMLRAFGVAVKVEGPGKGQRVSITGPAALKAADVRVPGDPSSAAFMIVAALIIPGSDIVIRNVMMNVTRTGLIETLTEMGAFIRSDNFRTSGGEIIADLHVKHSNLSGISVPPERAASMIDEYPILAVAASFANGVTVMNGISELRVKESDRIAATAALLSENGVMVEERKDGMSVTGMTTVPGGGTVATHHDHRIAMSALVLGLAAQNPVGIDDASMIATSFPTFFDVMETLGANISGAP